MAHLHLQIVECTGDSENIESPDLGTADIIATTPYAVQWSMLHWMPFNHPQLSWIDLSAERSWMPSVGDFSIVPMGE